VYLVVLFTQQILQTCRKYSKIIQSSKVQKVVADDDEAGVKLAFHEVNEDINQTVDAEFS
jgi:hypothetical protein